MLPALFGQTYTFLFTELHAIYQSMGSPIAFIGPTLALAIPIALMLYGVFTAQVYFYILKYRDDPKWLRIYVMILWVAESVHNAFCLHAVYTYLVLDFGDVPATLEILWSSGATVFMEIVIVTMVQAFFIYRAWSFSQRKWIVVLIPGVTLFLRCAFSFASTSLTYIYPNWAVFKAAKGVKPTLNIGLSLAVLVDVMVAAFLIYELVQTQRAMRFQAHYLQNVISVVVTSGALTVVFSLVTVLTVNVMSDLTFIGLIQIMSKLYANTMLANLNARKRLRAAMRTDPQVFDAIELSEERSAHSNIMGRNSMNARPIQVKTTSTTVVMEDDIPGDRSIDVKGSIV